MKVQAEVSAEKLRGGFYTPEPLVRVCLDRVQALVPSRTALRLLEPSAGDGAFFRGLESHPLGKQIETVLGIEPFRSEAAKCSGVVSRGALTGKVRRTSTLKWALSSREQFDLAVGNPPFVRFQFVTDGDRELIGQIEEKLEIKLGGVANLWIPILLSALDRLAHGGAFAFVVPTECFTGISAGAARQWLLKWTDSLHFDLFPAGSFPGVLQEVAVVSGRRRVTAQRNPTNLTISDGDNRWTHRVPVGTSSWTLYLLRSEHLEAIEAASTIPTSYPLGSVAKFGVSTVTGANKFFSVNREVVQDYELERWTLPLLSRASEAGGLVFDKEEHLALVDAGKPAYLLDFSDNRPDPYTANISARYLREGEDQGLHLRYKCRIRVPWYRVPVVAPGDLLLSKRSHRFPRLIRNEALVVTTDTIYRGSMTNGACPEALTASFHNTLTLLSSELQGRSFGGGVLELVPSEIARLTVLVPSGFGRHLTHLDQLVRARGANSEDLVEETDRLLVGCGLGPFGELLETLSDARQQLMQRRFDRN